MLRRSPETYAWLLDNIAPLVVGSGKYKEESKRMCPTKWMTPSSEAFAILCLENYYDNIQDVASNWGTIRKPLWTSKGLGARRNQGWNIDGMEHFEAYYLAVKVNRAEASSKKVDADYLASRQSVIDKNEVRKRKREETRDAREKGWNIAHTDQWSDKEETNEQEEQNGEVENSGNQSNGEDDSSGDEEEASLR
jgi:hypothetical protein